MSSTPKNEDYFEQIPLQNLHAETTISHKSNRKGLLAQILATGIIFLATVGIGMPAGYSAVLLPQLKNPQEALRIDDDMGSWIASMHLIGNPIANICSGTFMDLMGRKLALQLSNIPLILGWILIAFAPNHWVILLGRFFTGLCVGFMVPVMQVYLSEISDPHLRGVLVSLPFSSYVLGILTVYVLGSLAHWKIVAGFCCIVPILSIVLFFYLPESPVWLVHHNKMEQARKVYKWLKGNDDSQADREIDRLVKHIQAQQDLKVESTNRSLLKPHMLKLMFIVGIFNLLVILSGVYVVIFYAVDIAASMGNSNTDGFLTAILTGVTRLVSAGLSSFLLGITERRTIGMGSALGTGICAISLSVLLHFQVSWSDHFVTACLLSYVFVSTLGLLVLPGVMIGELFPIKIRGIGGGISNMLFTLMMFAGTKAYPVIKTAMGAANLFGLFGISSFAAAAFVYLFLPETKTSTLNDIENYFQQDNLLWITRSERFKTNK